MDRIGIDQESHLHTPGGPLHESPITHCDGCRWPIAECEYRVLDGLKLCRDCAVTDAVEVLICVKPVGRGLSIAEAQAAGILRAFLAEVDRA